MERISISPNNSFLPQTLFLYGTYKEDGSPNFGLFCWFSYCWDAELGVMACIGGEKLTKDLIRKSKVFSANFVNEPLLPLADYFGNTEGRNAEKMNIPFEFEHGQVLNVPVLKESPWVFELEVAQTIPLDDSEVYICKIRNTLAAAYLRDDSMSPEERMRTLTPVVTAGKMNYYSINPTPLGNWGDWKELNQK